MRQIRRSVLADLALWRTGLGRTAVNDFLNHGTRPHPEHLQTYLNVAVEHARERLARLRVSPSADPIQDLARYIEAVNY